MGKKLFIAEKPSVAREFANAMGEGFKNHTGFMESEHCVVTWCVGHLVTMSYPEKYDEKYRRWSFDTLPFLPDKYLYETIDSARDQFDIVKKQLTRDDVDTIYVCTDSGREGEYIYRLVEQLVKPVGKARKRVWIDSQTRDEIRRGISQAKDLSEYDSLSDAAYLRAKEDYLMGINFSRALSIKYSNTIADFIGKKRVSISCGRVMSCVLGMVVRREWEIRNFTKTPFFKVISFLGNGAGDNSQIPAEWKVNDRSFYQGSPKLYRENGFKDEETARELIYRLTGMNADTSMKDAADGTGEDGSKPSSGNANITGAALTEHSLKVTEVSKKKENRNPPLLFNLAELQNTCSKMFKISPDETLQIVQDLYEKKLATYPRTDARVLSTAIAKEISRNLKGLCGYAGADGLPGGFAKEILEKGKYKGIEKTRYVDDKQITDHYAIIPTGEGIAALGSLSALHRKVYDLIVRRFLSIFYEPAVYRKVSISLEDVHTDAGRNYSETFSVTFKLLENAGFLKVTGEYDAGEDNAAGKAAGGNIDFWLKLKKGDSVPCSFMGIRAGETTPPKRYNSGSMILAMENAGQLIEDEELRAQIKGSGIGTSATRAEILKKLVAKEYIALNKKSQILSPTLLGELVFETLNISIRPLLNPELTASWEKGLTGVVNGTVTTEEYMSKLGDFVRRRTEHVRGCRPDSNLRELFKRDAAYYKK